MVIMSGISALGSVLGGTWRNHLILGMTSERWKTSVTDAVRSRTKLRTTRRSGRNSVDRPRPTSTVTARDCVYSVAQNEIPQQTLCNFSATSCPILKILEAAQY